jgi:hypothetical protein
LLLGSAVFLECDDEARSLESASERPTALGGAERDVIVLTPEAHLVARFDAEVVSQILRDDDLPLWPNSMSHTT